MRKAIALALALVLTVALIPTAFAADAGMDDVVKALGELLPEPPEGAAYSVSCAGRAVFITIEKLGLGLLYDQEVSDPDAWRDGHLDFAATCAQLQAAVDRTWPDLRVTVFMMFVDERDHAAPLLIVSAEGIVYDAALGEAVWGAKG